MNGKDVRDKNVSKTVSFVAFTTEPYTGRSIKYFFISDSGTY